MQAAFGAGASVRLTAQRMAKLKIAGYEKPLIKSAEQGRKAVESRK
jgi:hypothetical protein